MDDRSSTSGNDSETPRPTPRLRRGLRAPIPVIVTVLLGGSVALLAERQDTTIPSESARHRSAASYWGSKSKKSSYAGLASVARRSRSRAPRGGGADNGSSAIAQAERFAAQGTVEADNTVRTAQIGDARICAILLSIQARVVARINVLIARFPFLAPRLIQIRARFVAQIAVILARFGCPAPSPG